MRNGLRTEQNKIKEEQYFMERTLEYDADTMRTLAEQYVALISLMEKLFERIRNIEEALK